MNDFALKVLTAAPGKTHLFATGQAGFIIKSKSGSLLAVDLYLSDCVERVENSAGYKRLLPKILFPHELELDVVVATHFHRDHFDIDAVPALMANGKTQLIAAQDCKESVRQLEMSEKNIRYAAPGDRIQAADFTIDCVPCDHGSAAPHAFGVMIRVDGMLFYEAGDTCLRMDRVPQLLRCGKPDVLMAPINGAFGNMNERECAAFAGAVGAALTIPCHYGMFAAHGGDVGKFYRIMEKEYPSQRFCVMAQGEKITF